MSITLSELSSTYNTNISLLQTNKLCLHLVKAFNPYKIYIVSQIKL